MAAVYVEGIHPSEFIVSEDNGYRSRESATITGSTDLPPATVLGMTNVGATASAAATSGNTGNGTMSAVTTTTAVQGGVYQLVMISATAFTVEGPNGVIVGEGKTGTAYAAGGLGFTLTAGGTAFVAGDSFAITVVSGTIKYAALNPSATDGTQNAVAVLYGAAKVSGGDVKQTIIARGAEVNGLMLNWPSGITNTQKAAATTQLAAKAIIVRN